MSVGSDLMTQVPDTSESTDSSAASPATETERTPVSASPTLTARAAQWVRTEDPGFLAIKKSARAAIVVPIAFALTHSLFSNPQVGLFGAFGSFAVLLLTDFPGRTRTRLLSYAVFFLVGWGSSSMV